MKPAGTNYNQFISSYRAEETLCPPSTPRTGNNRKSLLEPKRHACAYNPDFCDRRCSVDKQASKSKNSAFFWQISGQIIPFFLLFVVTELVLEHASLSFVKFFCQNTILEQSIPCWLDRGREWAWVREGAGMLGVRVWLVEWRQHQDYRVSYNSCRLMLRGSYLNARFLN